MHRINGSPTVTDPSAVTCVGGQPPNTGPAPTSGTCPSKDPTCTSLPKNAITYSNSWTCRNCFRIRANYKFKSVGVTNWEDKDFIDIDFKYKVLWLSYGHPIERVEQQTGTGMPKNRWRLYFKSGANFVSGMMWDANLQTVNREWINSGNIIMRTFSCPCSNAGGSTWGTSAPTNPPTKPVTQPTHAPTCSLGSDISGTYRGLITWYQAKPTRHFNWNDLKNSGSIGWTHFAALPKSRYNAAIDRYEGSANCGRCVRVRCSCDQVQFTGACQNGGTETILMVVDSCPTCPHVGDINTSTAGWNDITGNERPSRFDGTWEYVECPASYASGTTHLRVKPASSKFWFAFQPVGNRNKITDML